MSGTGSSGADDLAGRVLRDLSKHERTRSGGLASGPDGPPPAFTRFEILGTLGQGATATVYRARDRSLKREVALKVLREGPGEAARERFRREAFAAAALDHPNVVRLFDVGEESGRPFLVLELVDGKPLSEVLAGLDPGKAVPLIEAVARGVAAAHAKGVVHRDLKPANILVDAEGRPKVGDFGLAHLLDTKTELTKTGSALGTPLYMAPEQVEGRKADLGPRTDVYALGAILYQGLCGRPPHQAETIGELYRKILEEFPTAPPGEAGTIAMNALEKEPGRRYADAGELADDLERLRRGDPILARPSGPFGRLARRLRRHPLAAGLAGLLLVAGVAVGALFLRQARELQRLASQVPDPRPWTAVFDGSSTTAFLGTPPKGWRLEGGELVSAEESREALQTRRRFSDGELRVRFVAEDLRYLGIHVRLGQTPGYAVVWHRGEVERMGGAERVLHFRMKGDRVEAELDGAPQRIDVLSANAEGTLHVSGVGGRLRLRAIDFRE